MENNLNLPGNPRYQPKELIAIFGYDNLYAKAVEVELATLTVLKEIGVIPEEEFAALNGEVLGELKNIATTLVDKIEREVTHHDVRALVQIMQGKIDGRLKRWLHVPLTSYDVLDTARSLQFLDAYNLALKPAIADTVSLMIDLVEANANQVQIGRTHGQHALPITVGFWLATILNRIVTNWEKIDAHAQALAGKISGAVGAYNAQVALLFEQKSGDKDFEKRVLEKLGLKPARISTQILPPEPLAYFLFSCTMMSAALAQFGRDCRHLMRSEIGEIAESFESGQVGSSTMAHKRNPINFENLEGMYIKNRNEFGKVFDTLISEHQRDLTGSSVLRDLPIIVINLQQQLNTLTKKNKDGVPFLKRIKVDAENCQRNFKKNAHLILAEPLYIAIQMAGYEKDAHELVNRQLMPISEAKTVPLIIALETLAENNPELREILAKIPEDMKAAFLHPEEYIGHARVKAHEIAHYAAAVITKMQA